MRKTFSSLPSYEIKTIVAINTNLYCHTIQHMTTYILTVNPLS